MVHSIRCRSHGGHEGRWHVFEAQYGSSLYLEDVTVVDTVATDGAVMYQALLTGTQVGPRALFCTVTFCVSAHASCLLLPRATACFTRRP